MDVITLLIIDDGDDLLRFCQQFMPKTYHFIHARTGGDASRILETNKINLILLDKTFDKIDNKELLGDDAECEGIKILEMLRNEYPHINVMMITAYADETSQNKAFALNAYNYFSWDTICSNPQSLRQAAEDIIKIQLHN